MNTGNIISKAKQKDKSAQKQIYLEWAMYIYGICLRYSCDTLQAEDYMQESFMHIFEKINQFDPLRGAFKSWISTLTVNLILMDKRKRKDVYYENLTEVNVKIEYPKDGRDDILQQEINSNELLNAIKSLPLKYRDVLNLFIFDGWSHMEIAKALEISEGNSRARLKRAKMMLKQILTKNQSCHAR